MASDAERLANQRATILVLMAGLEDAEKRLADAVRRLDRIADVVTGVRSRTRSLNSLTPIATPSLTPASPPSDPSPGTDDTATA